MKTIRFMLIVLVALFANFQKAQACHDELEPVYGKIVTVENSTINGQLTLDAWWVFLDSMKVVEDSFKFILPNGWTLTSWSNFKTNGQWYEEGDSINFSISLNFPTANLPYYPEKLSFFQNMESVEGNEFEAYFYGHVFFTPWNTIEVFDDLDYYRCGRVWKNPQSGTNPARVFIHKDSIPVSDIDPKDSITEEWQEDYQLAYYKDLPFYVKQKPLHPDTLAHWDTTHVDSMYYTADTSNSFYKFQTSQFSGTVNGKLVSSIVNDRGVTVTVPISGIVIELRERDFGPFKTSWTHKLTSTITGADGSFSLPYSMNDPLEGGSIELELKAKAKNPTHAFRVMRHDWDGMDINLVGQAVFSTFTVGDILFGNQGVIDVGTLFETDHGFVVASKMENSFRYAASQGVPANSNYLIANGKELKVFIDRNVDQGGVNQSRLIGITNPPRLLFTQEGGRRERTIYHEWGHYYMWALHATDYPNMRDDETCLSGDFLSHSDKREAHISLAWAEGFADAIRNILDGVYLSEDQEFGLIKPGNNDQSKNGYERRFIPVNSSNTPTLTNGLRSELNIGMALYDMWDGPNTIKDASGNQLPNGNLMGNFVQHPYSDHNIGNPSSPILTDAWNEPDDIEISFADLMKPLIDEVPQNVNEYYNYLINSVLTTCEDQRGASRCMRENRVLLDITGYDNPASGNFLDFNTSMSADEIYTRVIFSDWGKDWACVGHTTTLDYRRNPIETIAGFVTSIPNSWWLSQNPNTEISNLTISEDLRLGFNFPAPSLRSKLKLNNNPSYNFNLELSACRVTWEFDNTEVIFGHDNSNRYCRLTMGTGSQFISRPNSIIRINNNSKLIIEEGATLTIYPGAQIILDGPNAILEIKGNLILEDGAEFKPIGGTNGQGYVVFDMSGVSNGSQAQSRVNVGVNSSMVFEASSSSTKVLEVVGQGLWIDDKSSTATPTSFKFTLKNGKAEIGNDAMLNLGCLTEFNNALVDKTSTATKYRGVYLWGHPNHIVTGSTFKNGKYGLRYTSTKWGIPIKVENSTFQDNTYGFSVEGGGFKIENCYADFNSLYGISAKGLLVQSDIQGSQMTNNDFQGLRYESTSAAGLRMSDCQILDNLTGAKFISRGDLRMKCCRIEGKSNGSSPKGLEIFSGNLLIGNGRKGGNNVFKYSESNLLCNDLWAAPKVFIDNGFNQFSNKQLLNDPQIGLTGSIDLAGATTLIVSNNRWDETTTGAPACAFGASGIYENYSVTSFFTTGPQPFVTITDNSPLSLTAFGTELVSACSQPISYEHGLRLATADGNTFPSNGTVITSSRFGPGYFGDIIDSVMNDAGDTSVSDSVLIKDLKDVLTFDGFPTVFNPTDARYIDVCGTMLVGLVGNYFAEKGEVVAGDEFLAIVQDAKDVFDLWTDTVIYDTGTAAQRLKNKMHLNKAHLLLAVDQQNEAQSHLSAMSVWADNETLEEVNYWLCQLNRFDNLNTSQFDYKVLDSLPECGDTSTTLPPSSGFVSVNNEIAQDISLALDVYPNPAHNEINVRLGSQVFGEVHIEILDLLGKKVVDLEIEKTSTVLTHRLNTSHLPSGSYLINVVSDDFNEVRKVILTK